jgi:hypothetical protein
LHHLNLFPIVVGMAARGCIGVGGVDRGLYDARFLREFDHRRVSALLVALWSWARTG